MFLGNELIVFSLNRGCRTFLSIFANIFGLRDDFFTVITESHFLFLKIFKNTIDIEFEYNLLGSLLFLIFLSFFTHFFLSHGYIHNVIILFIGIISFLLNFSKEKKNIRNHIKYISIIFGILIIALLTHKTHDDFPYYHFPYTYYLTQENLVIGAGQLVHAFRTPSSIFYLNSLFYLPIIEYFLHLEVYLISYYNPPDRVDF